MERWKTRFDAFLGIAIRGFSWRCHPASLHCVPFAITLEKPSASNFHAMALPGSTT